MPENQRNEIKRLIREELSFFLSPDRYVFQKHLQLLDGVNVQIAKGTGTKIGTETSQKIALHNATPVIRAAHIADVSIGSIAGGDTVSSSAISTELSEIATAVNAILVVLENKGFNAIS